jgi:hypothetical protein
MGTTRTTENGRNGKKFKCLDECRETFLKEMKIKDYT